MSALPPRARLATVFGGSRRPDATELFVQAIFDVTVDRVNFGGIELSNQPRARGVDLVSAHARVAVAGEPVSRSGVRSLRGHGDVAWPFLRFRLEQRGNRQPGHE